MVKYGVRLVLGLWVGIGIRLRFSVMLWVKFLARFGIHLTVGSEKFFWKNRMILRFGLKSLVFKKLC